MRRLRLVIPMRCASKHEGQEVVRARQRPMKAPKSYRDKQDEFRTLVRADPQLRGISLPIWRGPVGFYAVLYFSDRRRRDLDNLVGFLYDACSGVLWVDDHQVYQSGERKILGHSVDQIVIDIWAYDPLRG